VPPHLLLDNYTYMITGGTYKKIPFFNTDDKLRACLNILTDICTRDGLVLKVWAVMPNHYHIIVQIKEGSSLPMFIRKIHSKTAVYLNKLVGVNNRRVWYNYWDTCIRNEKDFYIKANYIHFNPVKHGYVEQPDRYEFSSYKLYYGNDNGEFERLCREYLLPESLMGDDF